MLKTICVLAIIGIIGISTNYVYSQEIGLATFQESAQIVIDRKINQESIASITLSSSNLQEIKIPSELEIISFNESKSKISIFLNSICSLILDKFSNLPLERLSTTTTS